MASRESRRRDFGGAVGAQVQTPGTQGARTELREGAEAAVKGVDPLARPQQKHLPGPVVKEAESGGLIVLACCFQ